MEREFREPPNSEAVFLSLVPPNGARPHGRDCPVSQIACCRNRSGSRTRRGVLCHLLHPGFWGGLPLLLSLVCPAAARRHRVREQFGAPWDRFTACSIESCWSLEAHFPGLTFR